MYYILITLDSLTKKKGPDKDFGKCETFLFIIITSLIVYPLC